MDTQTKPAPCNTRPDDLQDDEATYVVIYDVKDPCSEDFQLSDERYYGNFDTIEDAKKVFAEFREGQQFYGVKLCKILEDLPS